MGSVLDDTLKAFQGLMDAQDEAPATPPEGTDNFRCEHCVSCNNCRFCTECSNCSECTYCFACRDCLSLTQCRRCDASEKLSHSELCAGCSNSSYLTMCVDCDECVQCFGCVGLTGEEFCVLNEQLPRKEYFARAKELRLELDRRIRAGWHPPWLGEEAEIEADEEEAETEVEAEAGADAEVEVEAEAAAEVEAETVTKVGGAPVDPAGQPETE
ncbi:MAG: hypothetical protein JKY37_15665, partial [Nannocystaceae bacterium]|nr:hypothetical protein [Nannocystaceae bacterium]